LSSLGACGFLALGGCRTGPAASGLRRFVFNQPHMGTRFTLTFYAPDEAAATAEAEAVAERIAALEDVMTDYDPNSELMQLCAKPFGQPVRVSDDLFAALAKAQSIAARSDGAFDMTLGPVVRLWRRARRTGELPPPEALARARAAVGWQKVKLDPRQRTVTLTAPNMQLDLGGIGKGFAADAALALLRARGICRALVAASGDIAVGDPPPGEAGWRVGIGALDSRDGPPLCVLQLRNAAVSTAGDSEQFVEIGGRHYSHILDPATGLGLTNRMQVTVVARHAADTDALDTTVRVLGVERGLKLIEAEPQAAAFVQYRAPDGTVRVVKSRRWERLPVAGATPP
jgi:thiamine biosynthesis lipoprotein